MEKLLRLKDVRDMTGLGKSAIYDKIARGQFPAPVLISERAVAWHQSKVQHWIAQRPLANRQFVAALESAVPGRLPTPSSKLHPGARGDAG